MLKLAENFAFESSNAIFVAIGSLNNSFREIDSVLFVLSLNIRLICCLMPLETVH